MNSDNFNILASNYLEIGSWLSSCQNLPDELLLPHLLMVLKSVDNLRENSMAIKTELQNVDNKKPA